MKCAPAVLEPDDIIPTAPISTDYKEIDNKINFIVVNSHVYNDYVYNVGTHIHVALHHLLQF